MIESHILDALQKALPGENIMWSVTENRITARVGAGDLKTCARALAQFSGARFATLTATDEGLDIQLMYHFSIKGILFTLCTEVPKEVSQVASITDIFPAAEFIEREVVELFGVTFAGNLRDKNMFLPEDWAPEDKPLRKPLAGGLIPQARSGLSAFLSSGSSLGVPRSASANREKAGLSPLPPLAASRPEQMEKFQKLIKKMSFDKKVGYDWEKGKLRYR